MPQKQPAIEFLYKVYGHVTVLKDLGIVKNSRYVLGVCDCGTKKRFRISDLKNGSSNNCGCERIKGLKRKAKHGLCHHPLYSVWQGIKERCYSKSHSKYNRYGGRGISVCDEWREHFKSFFDWAMKQGYQKGLEIDRINNDGNYTPKNCRMATRQMNTRNKSNNRLITFNGETKCMVEWAEITGLNYDCIKDRIRHGWTIQKTLTTRLNAHLE